MGIFAKIMAFIAAAIVQGTPLLFGATGEIITEKSGNLNLGIPGIMYIGGISGIIGGYLYAPVAHTLFLHSACPCHQIEEEKAPQVRR